MSEPASISSGIAERYATAIFELSMEAKKMPKLEAGVESLAETLEGSKDFLSMITSPMYSREDQKNAMMAISEKLGLLVPLHRALGLMADKRRLFVLPQLISQLRAMIADHKGEVTAEVTSAKALTKAQEEKLAGTLKKSVGKDVKIKATVDESLIGGLVVKVGSKMIDTSIRSRLNSLQNAMKEVG